MITQLRITVPSLMKLRIPITARSIVLSAITQPSEMIASRTVAEFTLLAGRNRAWVKIGALVSKKLKGGAAFASARFASKKERMVPMSSQYPWKM